jgi:hypothetical protein
MVGQSDWNPDNAVINLIPNVNEICGVSVTCGFVSMFDF